MNADYQEVAQALVDAGYISDADIQAAADILADVLVVAVAETAEAAAMDDYSEQEDTIAEAEVWASEDDARGDFDSVDLDEAIIDEAVEQELGDVDTVIEAEAVISDPYADAAAALLAAELIDETNVEAVAAMLANFSVDDV